MDPKNDALTKHLRAVNEGLSAVGKRRYRWKVGPLDFWVVIVED
jgi:hypothetical protein